MDSSLVSCVFPYKTKSTQRPDSVRDEMDVLVVPNCVVQKKSLRAKNQPKTASSAQTTLFLCPMPIIRMKTAMSTKTACPTLSLGDGLIDFLDRVQRVDILGPLVVADSHDPWKPQRKS